MEEADSPTLQQNSPISSDQVKNEAGGFVWAVNDVTRLQRFLCLGSEGGTYYVGEKKLKQDNVKCIERLIGSGQGKKVAETVKKYSLEGRTAKQSSILYALAVCARCDNLETKRAAYSTVGDICRIPTFLFQFIQYCEDMGKTSGWGRAHRKAISKWYNDHSENPLKLAMHVTKYRSHNDWSHKDVLRLAHTKPVNEAVGVILRYIVKGLDDAKAMYENEPLPDHSPVHKVLEFFSVVEEARKCTEEERMATMIESHQLVREHVPTSLLKSLPVWRSLLKNMPLTAMIRNLGKMSSIGLLNGSSDGEETVLRKLRDESALKQARIHPFNVLVALKTYEGGHGEKGKLVWYPNKQILEELDSTYYRSFKFVQPTKKRYLHAVDVSGSMCVGVMGSPMSCRDAAGAMMMVTHHTEKTSDVVAFCDKLTPLSIKKTDSLSAVTEKMSNLPFGGTDCALPMLWAKDNKKNYDVFMVYTDSETWFGSIHPSDALRQYRKSSGKWDARLIVCGMCSNEFTIANPEDPGMLDVVGFDSAAPEAMRNFVMGEI